MLFLESLRLDGLLSFPPGAETISLTPLNVLIGPNGAGKSNLLEAVELLHATPTAFAAAVRDGGGVKEWLWKGQDGKGQAVMETVVKGKTPIPDLRYRLAFAPSGQRTEVLDEAIEERDKRSPKERDVFFYYRFQKGRPVLNVRDTSGGYVRRSLKREDLVPDESVLSQRKGSDVYPEVTWLGQQFSRIQTFREWSFGRYAPVRQPQPADLPSDVLLPDSRNLGLILNEVEHTDAAPEFNRLLSRFLPRYHRFSTRIQGGTVQFYLHEKGLNAPIPATRLSDGTIRFLAMLALLLSPNPPSLLCMEEPELGLHPDAVSLLADCLVDASTRTQLIVTTHSDALVSALTDHADSLLVCENQGGTVLHRVESQRLGHWLEKYRLGEILAYRRAGRQSVKEVAIYLEGGGDSAQQKAELRTGMDALLDPEKRAARDKELRWRMIPCGGREQTFDAFHNALQQSDEETLLILLVDSEDPIGQESKDKEKNADARVQHLTQRDQWDLSGADPKQVHLMVQCMEAWIVADQEALAAFYGKRFHANSLPNRLNLEEEPKADLLKKLKKSTEKTQKGEYAKIKHASKLLEKIDRAKVGKRCSRFATFTAWLAEKITGA